MSGSDGKKSSGGGGNLLPIIALLSAQLFTSSWHVLGKHVMHQVPFLAPISYVLIRTLVSWIVLLFVGVIHEGHVPFPPLFRDGHPSPKELSMQAALTKPSSSPNPSSGSIESGNSVGLSLSQNNSATSLNGAFNGGKQTDASKPHSLASSHKKHRHHHRPRRKKRQPPTFKKHAVLLLHSTILSTRRVLRNILYAFEYYRQQIYNLNYETVQIIFAGLSGMLILPTSYTTGLILTSPTVASVWDGPMIPLGCFCAAVTLGLEKQSKLHPFGQVGSLLLTVGGSIVVLLVDYLGGGHGMKESGEHGANEMKRNGGDHVQFIRGNMVLMGVVVAYSATALLQKRLNHYPPIQLTAWMFGIGHVGCLILLLFDSILGFNITGCSLGQALIQLYAALTTSPTFRYGLLYSALIVGGACFSIGSYASSHLESSVITLFAATQPPITAVLEWIWEGKALGWKKIGGMVCVGLGMWFFTYIKRIDQQKLQQQNHTSHSKKAQSHNSGSIQVSCSNGSVPSNANQASFNLTNRKVIADV